MALKVTKCIWTPGHYINVSQGHGLASHKDVAVHKEQSKKTNKKNLLKKKAWSSRVGRQSLELPAQSPDTKPPEHLWEKLDHSLIQYELIQYELIQYDADQMAACVQMSS